MKATSISKNSNLSERIPERGTESTNGHTENGWDTFREAYMETGKDLIAADFSAKRHSGNCFCAKCEWAKLEMADQIAAVKGIRERIEAGSYSEPDFWPKPKNYLADREWTRRVKPRRAREEESLSERIAKL